MKFLRVLCVLAMVFAFTASAYAETQSVKVSGDITMRGFARDNFDLSKNDLDAADVAGGSSSQTSNWATFAQSTAEIQVEADLTDNVSGVMRLVNQRVWGDQNYTSNGNAELVRPSGIADMTAVQTRTGGDAYTVDMDLAYIELKEFLYSPLTLKIGRQDLWFGKGFIIGNSLMDPEGALYAPEYTAINSFDAVRATLDYDPWTIDVVYAKISENLYRGDDDKNLMGLNVGYVFDQYNAEAEAYYWYKQDRNPVSATTTNTASIRTVENHINGDVHTLGMRGSFDPIEDWTVALEGAYQAGQFLGIAQQRSDRDRQAWAIDAMIECRYWQDDFAWKPVVSAEYIWYSGGRETGDRTTNTDSTYTGWDSMYRGKFDTAIREFQNVFYATRQASTPSYTNQHQILLKGTVEPTDSLTFTATYGNFWLDRVYQTAGPNENNKKYVGAEVDLELTWDYTEDVSFGLLTGWFFPGDHFGSNSDDIASNLVGTVKLSF
ncbi:MAG: alginate export family protein [Candidatus Omnitrophica bacterium]|nr:alginate export family protein [Candidatus Omnitrophota bacterium]MDD4012933.1 alginate export family protein [Candidatus Omnitrophota bacterium]